MPHPALYFVVTDLLEQPYRHLAIGQNAEWVMKRTQRGGKHGRMDVLTIWAQGYKAIEYERIEQLIN